MQLNLTTMPALNKFRVTVTRYYVNEMNLKCAALRQYVIESEKTNITDLLTVITTSLKEYKGEAEISVNGATYYHQHDEDEKVNEQG